MRKSWIAGGAVTLLAIPLAYWGLDEWTISGHAPRPVSVAWDTAIRVIEGYDPYRRCTLPDEVQSDGSRIGRSLPERNCFDFGPVQRFTGVYFDEFEGQLFIEGTPAGPPYLQPQERIWPSFDEKTTYRGDTRRALSPDDSGATRVFEVEWIGRKTVRAGEYGHFGLSQRGMIVDQVIKVRLLHKVEGYAGPDLLIRRKY